MCLFDSFRVWGVFLVFNYVLTVFFRLQSEISGLRVSCFRVCMSLMEIY